MFNYEEEILKLEPTVAKAVSKIVRDLSKIKKFRVLSLTPWKSNLPEILPFIGSKMENEIKSYLEGVEIQANDQSRRRAIAEELSFVKNDDGTNYFSKEWINKNILK